jgi:hypothetical protein
MSRARTLTLVVLVGLALLAAAALWVLPEIVRRVATDRITRATGRATTIQDVDLNLFTGRLAVKGFRLAEREGPDAFAEVERLDVRVGVWDLLRRHVRVREFALAAPSIRAARLGSHEWSFADLLAPGPPRGPEPRPSGKPWTLSIERASIQRGRIRLDDRGMSPASEWVVEDLEAEARDLTTRADAGPGAFRLGARINEARLSVRAEPLRLAPLLIGGRVSLDGVETRRLNPYTFAAAGRPFLARGGRFGLDLAVDVDSDAEEVRKAALSGAVTLEGDALVPSGRPDPFLSASRIRVEVREADIIERTLTLARVDLDGVQLAAHRDAKNVIDVVEMFAPRSAAPPPAAAPSPAPGTLAAAPPAVPVRRTLFPVIQGLARGFEQIRVERVTLAPSTVTFVDEGVTPAARLVLSKLEAQLDGFTWPVKGPASLTLSAGLPGGGTIRVAGPLTAQPFDADLTVAVRDAPVEPYQSYIPIPARLSGRFGGDSRNRIAVRNGGFVAQSKGDSWGQNVELREPGSTSPAIRVERMDLGGIDFDWPRRAAARKASFRRPRVEVERAADGSINVRRLFTPGAGAAASEPPPPPPRTGTATAEPKSLLDTMRVEFGEVRVEEGFVRFLDRTTQPAFSQDLSRLSLTVTDLGNRPGRRAELALQSVVGGDAGLDVRGEIGPLGQPAFVDVVGELRRFSLPSVDPYATAAIGWVIKQGELQHRIRFKLDGGRLEADNDVVIGRLQVAPARATDEVKRRIGLPLELIVALMKDQKGEIRVSLPVTGSVGDPKFALGDAIWTAVKNALVNIVTAPFKAIGRLFSRGEAGDTVAPPSVDPVTFAAGSAVLTPAMEEHLLRVADFLRRAPFVNLALAPVSSPADAEALVTEAVSARLAAFQKERGLADLPSALAEYYKARLPDVPPPPTTEAQLALLRRQEPAPEALLADLGRRRAEATRERLLQAEGIPASRLVEAAGAAPSPPAGPRAPAASGSEIAGGGRVEFSVVAGE